MDKEVEDNYSDNHATADFAPFDFSRHILRPQPPPQGPTTSENSIEMVDFILNNQLAASDPPGKLSFTDVMQFADFGPKLALLNHNQSNTNQEEDDEDDDSYFFKFNLMNERMQEEGGPSMVSLPASLEEEENNSSSVMQQNVNGGLSGGGEKAKGPVVEGKNRRKRGRSMKTSEEVESQRMTHIAVERNRRRQMNEHLRVLRSLMPGSYVQRGDQASIIGGAIEFVRELEQLLQCLESQKRRRLFGESGEPGGAPRNMKDNFSPPPPLGQPMMQPHSGHIIQQQPLFFPPLPLPSVDNNNMRNILDLDLDPTCSNDGPQEEVAENKSCIADIEVRVVGPSALIKILSRRRPGQLIKTIAALEDLQFCILHTNITTIEQTVLYSFNVKNTGEGWRTAEEIANSIQQILSFIDTSTI